MDGTVVTIVVFFFFSIFGGLWFPLSGGLQKFGEFTPTYQVVKITTDVIGHGSVAVGNVVGIVAWFAILFTGRYPRGLFDFVEGVARWHNRVIGYAVTLVTDVYPPFRLTP